MGRATLRFDVFNRRPAIAVNESAAETRNEQRGVTKAPEAFQGEADIAIPDDVKRVQSALLERYVARIRCV